MKHIALANSELTALVDEEDYPVIARYKWSLDFKGYAKTSAFGTTIRMHRMILNAPKSSQVDHKDLNKLNNRKNNLRLCNNMLNQANTVKRHTVNGVKTSSKYKGVHWRKDMSKWVARVSSQNKRIYLGSFNNEEDAARAYNKKALELWGEFAKINEV